MQNSIKREIVTVLVVGIILSSILYIIPKPTHRVYDCGMAEWHPDIPTAVKEECRKRRSHHLTTTLNKRIIV
jgi:hypothetical protein